MTPLEELLVKGSSRRQCFNCRSARLRPLIVLAKEEFPPGDERHVFTYSHRAIFTCDDCHHGYVENRQHDCFDFEEVFDQDQCWPLDGESIAVLTNFLPECPDPMAEMCACKVHVSLRESWRVLPHEQVVDFPPVLLHMADSDQDRLTIPRVALEAHWDLPWLVEKLGPWKAYDAQGIIKAEGSFWKGQMDGHWIFWYANGQKKAEGVYVNDRREGQWVEWNDRGEVISDQEFREGKPLRDGGRDGRK